jgi:hypothetical protein
VKAQSAAAAVVVAAGSVGAVGVIGYPSCRLAVVVGFSRRAVDLDWVVAVVDGGLVLNVDVAVAAETHGVTSVTATLVIGDEAVVEHEFVVVVAEAEAAAFVGLGIAASEVVAPFAASGLG